MRTSWEIKNVSSPIQQPTPSWRGTNSARRQGRRRGPAAHRRQPVARRAVGRLCLRQASIDKSRAQIQLVPSTLVSRDGTARTCSFLARSQLDVKPATDLYPSAPYLVPLIVLVIATQHSQHEVVSTRLDDSS